MGVPASPTLTLLQRIWRLNHAIERASARMESELGVSAPQRFIVRYIGRHPEITAGRLAELLHLDRGTVSATLRRLEEKDLIARGRDPHDGRRVILTLTPRGASLDHPSEGTVEDAVEHVVSGASDAELHALSTLLDRLCDRLELQRDAKVPAGTRQVP